MVDKPLMIYVAGPMRASEDLLVQANVQVGVDVFLALMRRGHIPFAPHLSYYADQRDKFLCQYLKTANSLATFMRSPALEQLTWADYMRYDYYIIEKCDALFFIAPSKGASLERELANRLNKQVFLTVDDVPRLENFRLTEEQIRELFLYGK